MCPLTLTAHARVLYLISDTDGKVYEDAAPCGCALAGWGTRSDPYRIQWCHLHSAATSRPWAVPRVTHFETVSHTETTMSTDETLEYTPPEGSEARDLLKRWEITGSKAAFLIGTTSRQIRRYTSYDSTLPKEKRTTPMPYAVLFTLAMKREGKMISLGGWRQELGIGGGA